MGFFSSNDALVQLKINVQGVQIGLYYRYCAVLHSARVLTRLVRFLTHFCMSLVLNRVRAGKTEVNW